MIFDPVLPLPLYRVLQYLLASGSQLLPEITEISHALEPRLYFGLGYHNRNRLPEGSDDSIGGIPRDLCPRTHSGLRLSLQRTTPHASPIWPVTLSGNLRNQRGRSFGFRFCWYYLTTCPPIKSILYSSGRSWTALLTLEAFVGEYGPRSTRSSANGTGEARCTLSVDSVRVTFLYRLVRPAHSSAGSLHRRCRPTPRPPVISDNRCPIGGLDTDYPLAGK